MATEGDVTPVFYFWDGTKWLKVSTGSATGCPLATAGQTLINFNGCLFSKNIDETGLFNWCNAIAQCATYNKGGVTGWYMPGRAELNIMYENADQPIYGYPCYGRPCPLTGYNSSSSYISSTVSGPGMMGRSAASAVEWDNGYPYVNGAN